MEDPASSPLLDLSADEVLATTRSVRKRLDLDRPVERSVIEECLALATQAPSGSNTQRWQWVMVEDADTKAAIADIYGANFDRHAQNNPGGSFDPDDVRTERWDKVWDSATYLRQIFHRVPVMMIPCMEGRPDGRPAAGQAGAWGSLLPAVWSFMLALRVRGLGSAWTTLHLANEREVAELLGIPYDDYTQAGLFPIAYTKGTDFRPAKRLPVAEIIHWDRW